MKRNDFKLRKIEESDYENNICNEIKLHKNPFPIFYLHNNNEKKNIFKLKEENNFTENNQNISFRNNDNIYISNAFNQLLFDENKSINNDKTNKENYIQNDYLANY